MLALLISLSRLYLGVHYPTDILGGIVIGILCGILLVTFVVMTKMPKAKRNVKHALYSLAPVVIAFICGVIVFNQAFSSALGITDKYWKYRGSELNGCFCFLVGNLGVVQCRNK